MDEPTSALPDSSASRSPVRLRRRASDHINVVTSLAGGGDMARLIRAFDWRDTALGPIEQWPHELVATLRLVLQSPQPMLLWWRAELLQFCNDACARLTRGAPQASLIGRPAANAWADGAIAPIETVRRTGRPLRDENRLVILERHGFPEEAYCTLTYAPVFDDYGRMGGVLCTVSDETRRVLAERRQRLLHALATRLADCVGSATDACHAAAEVLGNDGRDVPFALLYLLDGDGHLLDADARGARLAAASGVATSTPAAAPSVDLMAVDARGAGWPFRAVLETGEAQVVHDVPARFGLLPSGVWPEACRTAVVLPIRRARYNRVAGFLVVGISPRRPLDADYRQFLDLIGTQIASAIASVETSRRVDALVEVARVRRESQRRITGILESITDVFQVIDADWRYSYLNSAARRLLAQDGLDPQAVIGTHILADAPETPPLADAVREAVRCAMTEHKPAEAEYYCARRDRWYWVRVYPTPDGGASIHSRDVTARKQAEAALRASEQEFRTMFELSSVGMAQADASTARLVHANRHLCQMLGYGAEELLEQTALTLTHPEDYERSVELIRQLRRGDIPEYVIEKRLLRKDGSAVWVHVNVVLFRDALGQPTRMHAVIIDISEHKRAEVALRQSEERLAAELQAMEDLQRLAIRLQATNDIKSALEETLSAAIALHRTDMGSVQLYDPVTRQLLLVADRGFAPEVAQRYRVVGVDAPTACARAVLTGRRVVIEDILEDPARDYIREFRAVQSTPLHMRDGEPLGVLSTHFARPHVPSERELRMMDLYARHVEILIERMRAEQALKESEARFRTMADESSIMIWVTDASGRIEFLNRTFLEFFGLAPGEVATVDWRGILHPEDRAAYLAAFRDAMSAGKPLLARARIRRRDGQWRWIESRGNPRIDACGRVTGYVGSSPDITEIYETQQALKEADRRKDEFLATLAHELRNPLAPIYYSLKALRRAGGVAPAHEPLLDTMERKVTHVLRLVDDLLEISRITLGKIRIELGRVELAAVLHDAIETSRPLIEAAKHRLELQLPPRPIVLRGDAVRLAQVFANLLNNATRYTPEGGEIRMAVRQEDACVTVSVRDNGIGIAPAMLPRVFDLFTQADSFTGRNQRGLGIGLTLVRDLVQLHGGSVEARSDGPGAGTEIIVRLPLANAIDSQAPLSA